MRRRPNTKISVHYCNFSLSGLPFMWDSRLQACFATWFGPMWPKITPRRPDKSGNGLLPIISQIRLKVNLLVKESALGKDWENQKAALLKAIDMVGGMEKDNPSRGCRTWTNWNCRISCGQNATCGIDGKRYSSKDSPSISPTWKTFQCGWRLDSSRKKVHASLLCL